MRSCSLCTARYWWACVRLWRQACYLAMSLVPCLRLSCVQACCEHLDAQLEPAVAAQACLSGWCGAARAWSWRWLKQAAAALAGLCCVQAWQMQSPAQCQDATH